VLQDVEHSRIGCTAIAFRFLMGQSCEALDVPTSGMGVESEPISYRVEFGHGVKASAADNSPFLLTKEFATLGRPTNTGRVTLLLLVDELGWVRGQVISPYCHEAVIRYARSQASRDS
jgi:hypothetical protein